MRFLIDAALSPAVAAGLRRYGHDAVHLFDYDMLTADDREVLERAGNEERVVVSADTDFAMLLATTGALSPSFILFKHPMPSPESQVNRLLTCFADLEEPLNQGSIVVLEESRMRVRRLPVTETTAE